MRGSGTELANMRARRQVTPVGRVLEIETSGRDPMAVAALVTAALADFRAA